MCYCQYQDVHTKYPNFWMVSACHHMTSHWCRSSHLSYRGVLRFRVPSPINVVTGCHGVPPAGKTRRNRRISREGLCTGSRSNCDGAWKKDRNAPGFRLIDPDGAFVTCSQNEWGGQSFDIHRAAAWQHRPTVLKMGSSTLELKG